MGPYPPELVARNTLYAEPLVELPVHPRVTECADAAWPVPDSVMVVGEFGALLATLTLAPVTAPGAVGANVTLRVTD